MRRAAVDAKHGSPSTRLPDKELKESQSTVSSDNCGRQVSDQMKSENTRSINSPSPTSRKSKECSQTVQMKAMGGSMDQAAINSLNIDSRSIRMHAVILATSKKFEFVVLTFVVFSAGFIGYTTDYMAKKTTQSEPLGFRLIDVCFGAFFLFELSLRLFAYRLQVFSMWGWAWNWFDFFIVSVQLFDEVLTIAMGTNSEEATLLQMLRILRGVRVIRVLRVMTLAEDLQLLIRCINQSIGPFFWACTLLFLMVYIMSIYLTQLMTDSRYQGSLTDSEDELLVELFGSLPKTILSLVCSLIGGMDWKDLIDPVNTHVSPIVGMLYVFFIVFTVLAVMNVITANFVQTSLDSAIEIKNVHTLHRARKMFQVLDLDNSACISLDELQNHLEDQEVIDFFSEMDIDVCEAESLFRLIDLDNSGVIELEEFLKGCLRLPGPAKATDLLLVTSDFKGAFKRQGKALEALEEDLYMIWKSLMPQIVPAAQDSGAEIPLVEPPCLELPGRVHDLEDDLEDDIDNYQQKPFVRSPHHLLAW